MGIMESIYTKLALYGNQNQCARTKTVFLPLSEVCDGLVSLMVIVEEWFASDFIIKFSFKETFRILLPYPM